MTRQPTTRITLHDVLILAALSTLMGCAGSARTPDITPSLPREGDAHTAPPPLARDGDQDRDPWAGRDNLIETPAPAPVGALELPPVERFTLKNGLPVIVVKSDRLPVVHMQLAVKAGRVDSPRDKMGLAEFTAEMLSKGTRSRDAVQIAQTIDQVGGELVANAGVEATAIRCSALSKDLRTCSTLLADVTVNPAFPAAEMDAVAKQLLAAVRQRRDNAGQMATAHLHNLLWGEDHPRGWPMSARTIQAIERKDLQAWHKKWFVPDNAVLAVAGDVDPRALRAELERAFRTWRRGKRPARPSYSAPALQDIAVRLVDKPGQTQSHIRIGQPGIAHSDPAFFDHEVFNYVLGGGAFSSRLMRVVRSQEGKTYGASSSFERNRERGAFVVATFTRNSEVMTTLRLLLDELARMKERGPTQDEVRDAITHITGAYALRFQSAADVADALLAAHLDGLDDDYVREYPLAVARVTPESASKAAAGTLTPDRLAVVIVGDARQVAPQLDRAGWDHETVSYLHPIASYERQPRDPGPVDPEAEAAGRALLDRALAAKGGAARLARIKNMRMQARGKLVVDRRELPATFTRRYLAPDKLRMDIEIDLGAGTADVVTVLSGDKAWNKQPGQGVVELPEGAVQELQRQIWRDQDLILLRHRDKGTRVESLGEKTVAGRTLDAVRVTRGDGKVSATLLLDKKTHLPAMLTYTEQGIESVESYDEYRPVEGIQVAHRRRTDNQDAVLDIELTSVTFNGAMAPSLFTAPK